MWDFTRLDCDCLTALTWLDLSIGCSEALTDPLLFQILSSTMVLKLNRRAIQNWTHTILIYCVILTQCQSVKHTFVDFSIRLLAFSLKLAFGIGFGFSRLRATALSQVCELACLFPNLHAFLYQVTACHALHLVGIRCYGSWKVRLRLKLLIRIINCPLNSTQVATLDSLSRVDRRLCLFQIWNCTLS